MVGKRRLQPAPRGGVLHDEGNNRIAIVQFFATIAVCFGLQ